MKRVAVHTLALVTFLALGACSPEPKDEIRERISKDMKDAGRGASDAERDAVAGALAEDFASLSEEAGAVADEQARATEEFETRYGTVENAIATECVELEQALAALKQIESAPPDGETRTDAERESIQGEIERVATRLQETCGR
jgi:hypothetical protein